MMRRLRAWWYSTGSGAAWNRFNTVLLSVSLATLTASAAVTAYRSLSVDCKMPDGYVALKESDVVQLNKDLDDAARIMDQAVQVLDYLKNRVKELEEENSRLKSQGAV